MKNILNGKKCLEKLSELSQEIDDVRYFLEAFYGDDYSEEKCETCDEASVGLSIYRYFLNQIKSGEKDVVSKMYDVLGDDLLVIIDGGLLNKEDIMSDNFNFKKKKMPSFLFSIITFFKSISSTLFKSLKAGDGFIADEKTIKQRLAICRTCSNYQDGKCVLCTCPIKRKVKLKHIGCADEENPKW